MPALEDNIRSEDIQDILGQVPPRITRWGNVVIFFVIIALLTLGFTIDYPDTVPGRVLLSTAIPPATIRAEISGKLHFTVADNQTVRKDDTLAIIESTEATKNFMTAPIQGTVLFYHFWADQFVTKGDELLTIVPTSNNIIGNFKAPANLVSKIKIGQPVRISFDQYPNHEFGTVTGRVSSVSSIPKNNEFHVIISIPDGLLTNYKKTLKYTPELQGYAEIITEDTSVLGKLFYRLKEIF
jgi:multidrug resistance efflux pump